MGRYALLLKARPNSHASAAAALQHLACTVLFPIIGVGAAQ